jgi:hypothetical protein
VIDVATETTGGLITELEHMDEREARIHAALLRRLEALEQLELRSRSVSVADLHTLKTALDDLQAKVAAAQGGDGHHAEQREPGPARRDGHHAEQREPGRAPAARARSASTDRS